MDFEEKTKHSDDNRILSYLIRGVVIIVCVIAFFLLGFIYIAGHSLNSVMNFLSQPATAETVSTRTIITSLQPLGQLVSVRAEIAKADILVSVNTGGLNLCGHSAHHVAQGVIEAGIDITKVSEGSIQFDASTDTYLITLPAPNITSCRIEYIRQYERSGGNVTCGINWDTVRLLGQHEAMSQFASDTLEGGILERAERESSLLMQSFVGALTNSDVKIVYERRPGDVSLPPSCTSQVPPGWTLNGETQVWEKVD